jgi:hypothetical protein
VNFWKTKKGVVWLPLDPRFAGSDPAEDDGGFKGDENLYLNSLWRGSKAIVPML